ncbi:FxsA family protein [Oceanirhabdus sp. W0125-5]|uniref:FxsA family protein n=1 Tax=Oceanirhabdus sp. W0125-5 TaxID=2999116 RepID=UPI0022F2FE4B|nr:FxsA family protein [Oceanirhabdus sp. W0125-5]WBW98177.1 FxsA family protein [Oceanirhabdus sp. W0125-5]
MKRGSGIFSKLVLALTIVPILELYILFKLAGAINWGPTILLVICTGVAGAYLAKQQGREILNKIQMELSRGNMPGDSLLNGLCVLIGGVLLLTPGILTDITGFLLIIPISRIMFIKFLKSKFKGMINTGNARFVYINKDDYNEY